MLSIVLLVWLLVGSNVWLFVGSNVWLFVGSNETTGATLVFVASTCDGSVLSPWLRALPTSPAMAPAIAPSVPPACAPAMAPAIKPSPTLSLREPASKPASAPATASEPCVLLSIDGVVDASTCVGCVTLPVLTTVPGAGLVIVLVASAGVASPVAVWEDVVVASVVVSFF